MSDKILRPCSKAQAAFLDWGEKHPHSRIKELEFVDGQPMKIVVVTDDGIGTELVRFDKIRRVNE
jgi:hypothetical protein